MMMSNWYNLVVDENDDGALDVFILDAIGSMGTSAQDFISEVNAKSTPDKELRVHLNSPGGSVFDGLAIFNFLKDRGNVTTIVDGVAASMASVIFMAGSNRIMPANALLMIHLPTTGTIGEAEDLRKAADALDKMRDSLAGIYANATGKDIDIIKDMMAETTWMNGADAVKEGFATMATDEVKMAASFDVDKLTLVPEVLAEALAKEEIEMEKLDELQAKLQDAEAKLEEGTKDAEAKAKESFEAGVGTGEEQALGKIKSRMDKYQDAAFVIETIDLDDNEVKDKHIAELEAAVAAKDEAIAELSKDDDAEPVVSKASASSPDEVTVAAKSTDELYEARVTELKAEGKSAEEAHRTAHAEMDKGE
jgi:ATP-dependent Clp endopeptidase proteolytic subunit ClpP